LLLKSLLLGLVHYIHIVDHLVHLVQVVQVLGLVHHVVYDLVLEGLLRGDEWL
jgi:hypothetical protein